MAAALAVRTVVRIMTLDAKSLSLLTSLIVYHADFDYRSNDARTVDKLEGR